MWDRSTVHFPSLFPFYASDPRIEMLPRHTIDSLAEEDIHKYSLQVGFRHSRKVMWSNDGHCLAELVIIST